MAPLEDAARRLAWRWLFFIGVNAGANAIVVAATVGVIARVVRTPEDKLIFDTAMSGPLGYLFVYGASFAAPFALGVAYILPLIRIARGGRDPVALETSKRRLLNAPLYHGLIGAFGWLVAGAGVPVASAWYGHAPTGGAVADWLYLNSLFAGFCFVLVYYGLDFGIRSLYIPQLFPAGHLSGIRGAHRIPVRVRFFILYSAICVFPVFLFYRLIQTRLEIAGLGGLSLPLQLTTLILLGLCGVLTYLVAGTYQRPLTEMTHAVLRIRQGDLDVQTPVLSNDQLGDLADGVNEMAASLKEKEQIRSVLGRVVDPAVRDHLLRGNLELGGELRDAAILFSDIRGFTALSEGMRAPEVVTLLNRYFARMGACIEAEGGLVNKYIGDAVMALFGVPVARHDSAAAAVRAALRMRTALLELNRDLSEEGLPTLRNGIGIHYGPVLAGNIGSPTRMEYTVIGDAVNLASRVEGLCKELGRDLLITHAVWERLGPEVPLEPLSAHQVRGRRESVPIYAVP